MRTDKNQIFDNEKMEHLIQSEIEKINLEGGAMIWFYKHMHTLPILTIRVPVSEITGEFSD
jgi:hypothetical protein